MMMKKRYISPATSIVQMFELEHSVLTGSLVKFRMSVDPLEETYYKVDESGNETNSDYLIKF